MKNKTTKFLIKTAHLFFFFLIGYFLLRTISNSGEVFSIPNLIFATISALMNSFGIIFWNLFDYEKYDNISYVDFLESTHSLSILNNDENWNAIHQYLKDQLLIRVEENSKNLLKVSMKNKLTDSILTAKRSPNEIAIKIERKSFKFLPDNASNYRIMVKIAKQLSENNMAAVPSIK